VSRYADAQVAEHARWAGESESDAAGLDDDAVESQSDDRAA
jgi:hypothetical protein